MGVSIWQLVIITFILGIIVFGVWLNVRILNKAGYSGWWAAILFVPVVNIIMIWVFAFSKWPILNQRRSVSTSKESDEAGELYAIAWRELESENYHESVWAKAFAHANGNEAAAKAGYIELRVSQLLEAEAVEAVRAQRKRCPSCNADVTEAQAVCGSCNKVLPWSQ
ncbi:hypothetical protein MNBD_GAMMA13-213 [hydrothermal vent metagenome]|uniref:Zinc-ribbon domain-containing protein n=1 Tax=hydrothermal vent metagenome TaxID=652676 RepID=A0A3B0YNM7_9ZZZZ